MRSRAVVVATLVTIAGAGACAKDTSGAMPVERGSTARPAEVVTTTRGGAACGPRGLPPDRHFVAEGLCARVVAHKQGPLRGITFASSGDLLAVTSDGEIRRYRDVDHDGLYEDGAPESIVWATIAADVDRECHLDEPYLYCGSTTGVKRWRYSAEVDHGGPGDDVVVGIPEGARHSEHPLAVWDGFVYASGERNVVKRFAIAKYVPGRPLQWRDGEVVARYPSCAFLAPTHGKADRVDDTRCSARLERPMAFAKAQPSALGMTSAEPDAAFALDERWRSGAFVALHGSSDGDVSTGYKVTWIPSDAAGRVETVFGGGKYGAPRDGEWSWKLGDAGEDPVRPVGVAVSPIDGALYVSSDNAGGATTARRGSIYRIALLGK
jgi:hypothetical protein